MPNAEVAAPQLTDVVATQPEPKKETPEAPKTEEQVQNPEAVLKKNRELLGEIKSLQAKRAELEKQVEDAARAKLEEKEEFKTLYEQEKQKLEELKPLKLEAEKYKVYFSKQLEQELENVPESVKAIIEQLTCPIDEKLEHLAKLKGDMGKQVSSFAAQRPGGRVPEVNIEDFKGPNAQAKLVQLSLDNPEMYKLVMEKLKQGA
jgi:uncharacterized protein YPO0396